MRANSPTDVIDYLKQEQTLFNEASDNVAKGNLQEDGNMKFHSENIIRVFVWFMQNGYVES